MERPLDTLGNKKNIRKSISLGQYCQKKNLEAMDRKC